MNVARRESVPIGERTSDNWGRVRREAVPRQARAPSYIVDCLTVTGGPLARPPAPEGLGDKRERPPPDRRAPIGTAAGWHLHSHATPRSGVAPAP